VSNAAHSLLIPNVEPRQRWVGGGFGYAVHRFPIKGGITMADVLKESIYDIAPTETPFLIALLSKKAKQ
jgi:hypothetical protein